ncbi:mCG1034224, partial [Mus musculus]
SLRCPCSHILLLISWLWTMTTGSRSRVYEPKPGLFQDTRGKKKHEQAGLGNFDFWVDAELLVIWRVSSQVATSTVEKSQQAHSLSILQFI